MAKTSPPRRLILRSPAQRQIMPYVGEDLSYIEIGAKLGVSERAARARVERILAQNKADGILPANAGRIALAIAWDRQQLPRHGLRVVERSSV